MKWSWIKYKIINEYTYKKIFKRDFIGKRTYIRDLNKYVGRKVLDITETNIFINNMIKEKVLLSSYVKIQDFPE